MAAEKSDRSLLERAQAGDEDAVAELLERYKPLTAGRAWAWSGASEQDDLLQEAMIGLYHAIMRCPPERREHFSAYAWQSVENRLRDLGRARGAEKRRAQEESLSMEAAYASETGTLRRLGDTMEAEKADPEALALEAETRRELLTYMDSALSAAERHCLLRFLAGDSYDEIGQSLGLSRRGVDGALRRARKKLRLFRGE